MGKLADKYASQNKGLTTKYTGSLGVSAIRGTLRTPSATLKETKLKKESSLPGVIQKFSDVGGQLVDLGAKVGSTSLGYVGNVAVDIAQKGYLAGKTYVDSHTQPIANRLHSQASEQLDALQTNIETAYKSGKMGHADYIKAQQDIAQAYLDISKESQKISKGPSPNERAFAIAETAVNMLSVGSLKLAQVGGIQAKQAGSREAIESVMKVAATKLEQKALRLPVIQDLVLRNLQTGAKILSSESRHQFILRNSRNLAAGLLIKRPLVYHLNIEQADDAYDKLLTGEYKGALTDAAWLGSQMIRGGPLGLFFRGKDYIKGGLRDLAYGRQSFIDELSKRIGDGNPYQIARFIQTVKAKTGAVDAIPSELEGKRPFKSTTDNPEIDAKGKLTEMTPDEYLKEAFEATDGRLGGSYESWLASNAQDASTVAKYAEAMKKGDEFPTPYIDKAMGSQDGRNRALAAKQAGIDKIPVKVVPEMTVAQKIAFAKEQIAKHPANTYLGNKYRRDLATFEATQPTKGADEFLDSAQVEKTFRILQETNLRMSGESVDQAVDNVLTHYTQHGYDLANITPAQLYKDMSNWAKADELTQRVLSSGLVKGINPEDASKYVVVRWDKTARGGLIDAYRKGGHEAVAELMQQPGVGWANNRILRNAVENAVNTSRNADEFANKIRNISTVRSQITGLPKKVASELSEYGYVVAEPFGGRVTPIVGADETRKLVTAAIKQNDEVFDLATAPQPEVAFMAGLAERFGLSPVASSRIANRKLAESVTASLDNLEMGSRLGLRGSQGEDLVHGGQAILSRLQEYIESRHGALGLGARGAATDIRQLTLNEIGEALGVTKADAREVSQAIMDGYLKTPLEFRGLGDKVVDAIYAFNPAHKYYSRIQSALRYTYNPFFRLQERVETAILSRAQANNLIWNKSRSQLDNAADVLEKGGIFSSSLPGEAAQDQVIGRITANITRGQKRDLAGLAMDIADARGISLQQLVSEHADEVDDALRVVVQYPRKGFLASPLARTMNLAFFPMRYNLKVTELAAKTLATQPPAIQKAFLHSMFQMRDWLKSDEGIVWQQKHADAIQIFNWVTPVNSISYTMKILGRNTDGIADLGVLGGLPLGVISQVLDGQGLIKLNRPYVDPKTGDVIPDYIPETAKAKAATALVDILNTMFTYPGRILGLPGKTATLRKAVRAFIDTNGSDFEKRLDLERLTPLQRKTIEVLKGDLSDESLDSLYNLPAEGEFNWYTIPSLDIPVKNRGVEPPDVERRTGLPSGKRGRRTKKIAQPIQ